MSPRARVNLLTLVICLMVLSVEAVAIGALYRAAFQEERQRLEEAAKSQARMIEAMERNALARGLAAPEAKAETLAQVRDAHSRYRGFGETGEFTLGAREGDQIVYLLRHRHFDLDRPKPVRWDSGLGEPMRLALSGKSGTLVGQDYRGVQVVAAHEPVAGMDLGVVAKIDLAEVRWPFFRASLASWVLSVLVIVLGTVLFRRLTDPIIRGLGEAVTKLETALSEVKTLRGILPICSFCKRIRDEQGSWSQVDEYVRSRSEAEFSHGICPECLKAHYPEQYEAVQRRLAGRGTGASSG